MNPSAPSRLSHAELLELKRWNTPTIFNGWEQVTRHNVAQDGFNLEEVRDFMPQMGPMVGYAVTVRLRAEQSQASARKSASLERLPAVHRQRAGPEDRRGAGSRQAAAARRFWGEVNSNIHKALGCVGSIIDGAIRDLDEMNNAGFKALARRLAVGHAFSCPVRWGCEVEVFGRKIQPGQLIHADKHGFLAIPPEDEAGLLEAARFMDSNECQTIIAASRGAAGKPVEQILADIDAAAERFGENAVAKFGKRGEW